MIAAQVRLGEILAIARELRNMTLRDLEAECGVSNALISQIETGKVKDPGFSTVVRIAHALGLSVERCAKPYIQSIERRKDVLRKHLQQEPAK
jgi:transcriptional regulator with XRE-family HTH domain